MIVILLSAIGCPITIANEYMYKYLSACTCIHKHTNAVKNSQLNGPDNFRHRGHQILD